MNPVAAVHGRRGSFSERWLEQAGRFGFAPREVDGYSSDVMEQLAGCRVFLWHLSHDSRRDLEFGRDILRAAEAMGVLTFPNSATCAHFDDKVAQARLLQALGAPIPDTWIFFSRDQALRWAEQADFPVVFKLRRGAGSANVRLVAGQEQARRLVGAMFGRGFSPVPRASQRIRQQRKKSQGLPSGGALVQAGARFLRRHLAQRRDVPRERGYVLFQRFLAGNDHDTRVTVIGDRAFTFRRRVREKDFRASGSGLIEHLEPALIERELVELAFDLTRRGGFQAMAYDFVRDLESGRPRVVEISYVFNPDAIHACSGFFDRGGRWHAGQCWPQDLILEDLAAEVGT